MPSLRGNKPFLRAKKPHFAKKTKGILKNEFNPEKIFCVKVKLVFNVQLWDLRLEAVVYNFFVVQG